MDDTISRASDLVRALRVLSQKETIVCREAGSLSYDEENEQNSFSDMVVKRGAITVREINPPILKQLFKLGCLQKDLEIENRWRISKIGRQRLKRALSRMSEADENVTMCHGLGQQVGPGKKSVTEKTCDSPLAWLRRRKDKYGHSLIDDDQFDAGERLREDFHKGQMGARVITNWSAASFGGSRGSGFRDKELSLHEAALLARERVRRALQDVGPELSGVLIDVCCYSKKITEAERAAGLPQRSGKVVLCLALAALARHYGLIGAKAQASRRRAAATRHWGSEGYRPSLDGDEQTTA